MHIFSLRSNVYEMKINMKNSMQQECMFMVLWNYILKNTYQIILIRLEIQQMISSELSRRKISFTRSYVSGNGSKIRTEKRTGYEIREDAKAGQLNADQQHH